jgi:hypothetical protein
MARLEWRGDQVMNQLQREFQRRAQRAAHVAEQDVKAAVSTPYPPAARPGEPPHRRTGTLARAIKGTAITLGRTVVVQVRAMIPLPRLRTTLAEHPFTKGTRRRIARILRTGR